MALPNGEFNVMVKDGYVVARRCLSCGEWMYWPFDNETVHPWECTETREVKIRRLRALTIGLLAKMLCTEDKVERLRLSGECTKLINELEALELEVQQ